MPFQEIFGQEKAIQFLEHDLQTGSVAHAYLFSGPRGIGKTKTAIKFAKVIADIDDPQIHPDFQIIKSFGSNISIDQVRQLESWVTLKASRAKNKVVVIEDIERMSEEAANALLKTLEEPVQNVVFIITTSNINALLPTVISRCRQIKFKPIDSTSLRNYLSQKGYQQEKIELAANLSQGVFAEAISFIENDKEWQLRKAVLDLFKDGLQKPVDQVSALVESFLAVIKPFEADKNVKDEQTKYLPKAVQRLLEKQEKRSQSAKNQDILLKSIDFWWFFLRDVAVYSETGKKDNLINIDYFDEIAKRCHNNEGHKSWELVQKIPKIKELIKQNINPQLAIEATLMEVIEKET